MSRWSNYSIRKQLLIVFGSLTFISLIIPDLISVTYITVVSHEIGNGARSHLMSQATTNIQAVTKSGADLIDRLFSTYSNNFINTVAIGARDTTRSDYPFGYIPSYYNWVNTLIDESYSSSLNANITLNTSTFNVYNNTPAQIQYLSDTMHRTINRTASLDLFFIPLHQLNGDFLQQYIGTELKFQRNYPGSINYNALQRYVEYDPTADYWYQNTLQHPDTVVYSSPYFDPIANQTMITISRTLNDVYTGRVFGAVGGDLTLQTISDIIRTITYMTSGRVMLFEKTGLLVADSRRSYSTIPRYSDLYSDIQISASTWDQLTGSDQMIDTTDRIIQSVTLVTGSGQYVLLSFVSHDDVYRLINPLIDSITDSYTRNMIIIFSILFTLLLLVMAIVMCLTNSIVRPLNQLAKASEQIISNIGSANIAHGVEMKFDSNMSETRKIFNQFKLFVDTYEQKKKDGAGNIGNQYYNATNALQPPDYSTVAASSTPVYRQK